MEAGALHAPQTMEEDDVVVLEEVDLGSQVSHAIVVEDVVVVVLLDEVDFGSQVSHAIVVVVATVVVVVFATGSTTEDELQSPHPPGAAAERPLSAATVRSWERMLAEMG